MTPVLNEAYFGPEQPHVQVPPRIIIRPPADAASAGRRSSSAADASSTAATTASASTVVMPPERTVLVTGVSGNLGTRLLPLLSGFRVVGVDMRPPDSPLPLARVRRRSTSAAKPPVGD